MKTVIFFTMAVSLVVIANAEKGNATQFDYSRPFPLSLLEYSNNGGEFNPWPFDVANIQINTDSTNFLQNEEMVAINPQNTDNAVALWRDFRLGYRRIGVGYTFDAGQTWHDTLLVVSPYPWQSDPVLTVDSSGNFFACSLCIPSDGGGPSGIYVQKSTDGGVTWLPEIAAVDNAVDYFEDKQMIVLDRNPSPSYGNIYISWTRFTADLRSSQIVMIASRDAGQSYSSPVSISDNGGVQWSVPAVGSNGDVYVAWYRYFPAGIYFDVSTDQGQTFGSDTRIIATSAQVGEINGGILVFPFPALTTDVGENSPYRGTLYIAYMDHPTTDMDIFFVRSTDGGLTWSSSIRVNDDGLDNGADQFHPWISVDGAGVIHIIFFDRRLDEVNNMLFDLFYTRSIDGGLTWSPNERITTVSSDPSHAALAGLIGEYIGLSAWSGQVQMVWTDTRNGNQDVFSGRMDATGVAETVPTLPGDLNLRAVYPNPFNNEVALEYYSSTPRQVAVEILDLLGRKIKTLYDASCVSGTNRIIWDGTDSYGHDVASGPYFVRLASDDFREIKKAILLR